MIRLRRPTSIKGTLLALLIPSGIVLMTLAWLVHGTLLDRMAREVVEGRLRAGVAFLEHQVRMADNQQGTTQASDYFDNVFHLAFAIRSSSDTVVSPSSWRRVLLPVLDSDQSGNLHINDVALDGQSSDVLILRKVVELGGKPVVLVAAEDLTAFQKSQGSLHIWTAVVSLLLIVLVTVVIWFGIDLAMRPVFRLQSDLKRLQEGDISRIPPAGPDEFRPLIKQMNQLLEALDQRLERSRNALANLSHSVKTPIAAVRQILMDEARPLTQALRRQMDERLNGISQQLESELRRGQLAGPQVGKSAGPERQARDLLWMLGRLYPNVTFELNSAPPDDARWPIEEHDFAEILGNVLDNAGKWARSCVELSLQATAAELTITVTDDGPGVPETEMENLGQRGLRLDEQTPGHGLGLAIVRDIVTRYGGRLSFSGQPAGGLRVSVALPARPKDQETAL